ncbi:hypothetical protein FRC20_001431 [Serendipita sp. 405]|nr:hypothetical protein FRC15_001238 [Serendipita sp. 397]KAG8869454.1 hypothetical protein FRC20_001431 [Serendipita sp. 405]
MSTSDAASIAPSSYPLYQVSKGFPDGKGDITLLTVDNVIFHVHRAILQHSSAVFETIFEAGDAKDEEDEPTKQQLKFEADAATLDLLLRHIYQNHCSPRIEDVDQLASVFRAAKRYEMEGVFDQLRRSLLEMRITRRKVVSPLYIRYPFAILAITYAFELYEEARLALRECMKGDMKAHMEGASNFDVPVPLMNTIISLRESRANWFKSKLDGIPWPSTNCIYCYRKCAEWRCQLERNVMSKLDFEVVRRELAKPERCENGHDPSQLVPAGTLSAWSDEWKKMQEVLPELPEDSFDRLLARH